MAEALNKLFCMVPTTDYMLIEDWDSVGTDVTIVEDEGTPTAGETHAAELIDDKNTTNYLRTKDLLDDGTILRATVAVKFKQRDIYQNENIRHHFLQIFDNGGANQIATLFYEGIDVNNNRIGVMDSTGATRIIDTGPFTADTHYVFDCIYRHSSSVAMWVWRNKTFKGTTGLLDFHTTAGPIQYMVQGQIRNAPGPGGRMYCSLLAHFTGAAQAAAPNYAKYLFRPYNSYGPNPVCDHNGNLGGPALFSGSAENMYDNAVSRCGYRGTFTGDAQGGAWACGNGPAGQFAEGTVLAAVNICGWTDFSTKGGADEDPHLLYGTGNSDLDTFTIVEHGIDRGANVKSAKLLLPGDTGFPTINEFTMLGFLVRQTAGAQTLAIEEILQTCIVEHPAPPLTQVKVLGDTLVLGEMRAAG